MFPSFNILGKEITAYLIMATIGILVCGFVSIKLAKKNNIDADDMLVTLLISGIGLLIGGHLLYGITRIDVFLRLIKHFDKLTSFKQFIEVLTYIFGGQVFYGGLIGALITGYIYVKKKKYDIKSYFDIAAVIIPLFHFFGRIGCFLSGCCYGVESKIGFTYHHSVVEMANGVNRFPIQLVESGYNLIIFIVLITLLNKNKLKGKLIYLYLLLYPIGRFIFEFFRGDSYRGFIFGLSTSQFISIILFIFSLVSLIVIRKKDVSK